MSKLVSANLKTCKGSLTIEPSTLPPRPANQTSIPSMLTGLQAEFDAIMLESLEIKKQYTNAR